MTFRKLHGLVSVLAAMAIGCSQEADDPVFVVVNGRPLTVSYVRDSVLIKKRILELAGSPVKDKDFVAWANASAMQFVLPLMNAELIDGQVTSEKIEPSMADFEKALADYKFQTGKNASSLDELAACFGDLEKPFRRQFDRSVRIAAYERVKWSTMPVTDRMIDLYYQVQSNAQVRAKKIDAQAREKADRVYARLRAGEAWSKVAAECSEDKAQVSAHEKYATSWVWAGLDAMGIKELIPILPTMKKGDFTRPIETPDGLIIVRLVDRKNDFSQLARILIRLAQPVSVPASRERAREVVAMQLTESKKKHDLKALWKRATFAYPMGTNFTYKIWKETEQ